MKREAFSALLLTALSVAVISALIAYIWIRLTEEHGLWTPAIALLILLSLLNLIFSVISLRTIRNISRR